MINDFGCIIFDCDGVLVDSEAIANRIGVEALRALGCQMTVEESIKRFTGMNDKTERQILYNDFGINLASEFFVDRQLAVLKAFETELKPLMTPVLNILKNKTISRCVASSSPRERVIHSLNLTKQFDFFDENFIFTSQQVTQGKPAPDLFLFAANKMGYLPEHCVVIEDSFAGIEAALAAKMTVIAYLGGSHAQYDWYHQKIKDYKVPVVKTGGELLDFLFKNELAHG